jgi:hypothetical protein
VVWVTWNFRQVASTSINMGGDVVPWAGDDEHSVLVYGFQGTSFMIWNPWNQNSYGAQYIGGAAVPMNVFDGAYSTYDDMAVVLN